MGMQFCYFLFCLFLIGLTPMGKNFAHKGTNFYPLRVDPFLEGFRRPGKLTGTHKKLFYSVKGWKNINVYPYKYMYL